MIRLTLVAVGCLAWFDGPSATPGPRPSYEQVKAATGRDAASQVKLALWCESHGLEAHKLRHLAVAVLSDPANAMAHGLMGLVEYGGKWKRPEAVAEAVKADPARRSPRRIRRPPRPDAREGRAAMEARPLVRGKGPEGQGAGPPGDGRPARPESC